MTRDPKVLEGVLKDVMSRTFAFRPPKGFDPLKAAAAELLRYGFATEPDLRSMPERHAAWARLLSGPLNFVEPQFEFDRGQPNS